MRPGRILIVVGACLGGIALLVTPTALRSQGNLPAGVTPAAHTGENAIDLGTDPGTYTQVTVTTDCAACYLGYTDDRWDFTLTAATDVTVEVADCCLAGDRFEARFNDRNVDEDMDADLNNHEEDCIGGRQPVAVAPGVFDTVSTVTLSPGDWTVRVRDVAFQCDNQPDLCAAGYDVRISFGPPTGMTCPALTPCTDLASGDPSCQDQAGGAPVPTLGAVALAVFAILIVAGSFLALRRRRRQPA